MTARLAQDDSRTHHSRRTIHEPGYDRPDLDVFYVARIRLVEVRPGGTAVLPRARRGGKPFRRAGTSDRRGGAPRANHRLLPRTAQRALAPPAETPRGRVRDDHAAVAANHHRNCASGGLVGSPGDRAWRVRAAAPFMDRLRGSS